MREIVFRGMTKEGKWVEGLPFNYSNHGKISTYIQTDKYAFKNGSIYGKEVWPETISECTGLKDKYGKKAFEGDKFQIPFQSENSWYVIEWSESRASFIGTLFSYNERKDSYYHTMFDLRGFDENVIIGNIYEVQCTEKIK